MQLVSRRWTSCEPNVTCYGAHFVAARAWTAKGQCEFETQLNCFRVCVGLLQTSKGVSRVAFQIQVESV